MPDPLPVSAEPMRVYRGLTAARADPPREKPRLVSVGQFDGVHLGHQALLAELRDWAAHAGAEPTVLTFHPHPLAVLTGERPPRVLSLEHRLVTLAGLGIARVLVLPFTREVAALDAEAFVRDILVDGLGASGVLMGFDSAWGRGRAGTYEFLSERAGELGVEVRQAGARRLGSERVSSTLVRAAIRAGDLARLRVLLGRSHSVMGRVVRGDGRGRGLGFPTANIDCAGEETSPPGVYFAEVSLWRELAPVTVDGVFSVRRRPHASGLGAIVNVGARPTFKGERAPTVVEVHLIDFDEDLYDQFVEVHFLEHRREERAFASGRELARQIAEDVAALRVFLAGREAPA